MTIMTAMIINNATIAFKCRPDGVPPRAFLDDRKHMAATSMISIVTVMGPVMISSRRGQMIWTTIRCNPQQDRQIVVIGSSCFCISSSLAAAAAGAVAAA